MGFNMEDVDFNTGETWASPVICSINLCVACLSAIFGNCWDWHVLYFDIISQQLLIQQLWF